MDSGHDIREGEPYVWIHAQKEPPSAPISREKKTTPLGESHHFRERSPAKKMGKCRQDHSPSRWGSTYQTSSERSKGGDLALRATGGGEGPGTLCLARCHKGSLPSYSMKRRLESPCPSDKGYDHSLKGRRPPWLDSTCKRPAKKMPFEAGIDPARRGTDAGQVTG